MGVNIYLLSNIGSVQECNNCSVLAMDLLQPCTEPSVWADHVVYGIK